MAYDGAHGGPSAHYYRTENRALRPEEKLHAPGHTPLSDLLAILHLLIQTLLPEENGVWIIVI